MRKTENPDMINKSAVSRIRAVQSWQIYMHASPRHNRTARLNCKTEIKCFPFFVPNSFALFNFGSVRDFFLCSAFIFSPHRHVAEQRQRHYSHQVLYFFSYIHLGHLFSFGKVKHWSRFNNFATNGRCSCQNQSETDSFRVSSNMSVSSVNS